jgi:hypothetical protein
MNRSIRNAVCNAIFVISALFFASQTCAQTQPTNASFETPLRGAGQYANPTDSNWSFSGASGIVSNAGGAGAHHGVHFAYLKGSSSAASRGRVSQVLNFPAAGLYQLRFLAGGNGTLAASVGGAVVGNTLRMRLSTGYNVESWWTQPFTISAAGSYEIAFSQESAVDTDSIWIDNVIVASSPLAVTNASFEQFDAAGIPNGWTVSNAVVQSTGTTRGGQGSAWLSFNAGGAATTTINVPAADTYSGRLEHQALPPAALKFAMSQVAATFYCLRFPFQQSRQCWVLLLTRQRVSHCRRAQDRFAFHRVALIKSTILF